MTKAFYDRLSKPFENNIQRRNILIKLNKVITYLVYMIYLVLLLGLLAAGDGRFLRVLLVPAVSFAAVTAFRRVCNAKRPYEVWDTPPLIAKETKGNSFPSRHVFSIYMIAMAVGYISLPLAVILAVAGIFLAAARVIARVHFIKDVAAGAVIALLLGWIGFYVI